MKIASTFTCSSWDKQERSFHHSAWCLTSIYDLWSHHRCGVFADILFAFVSLPIIVIGTLLRESPFIRCMFPMINDVSIHTNVFAYECTTYFVMSKMIEVDHLIHTQCGTSVSWQHQISWHTTLIAFLVQRHLPESRNKTYMLWHGMKFMLWAVLWHGDQQLLERDMLHHQ